MQVCGETVSWDAGDLVAAIRPGYGYGEDSAQITWLREVLLEMTQLERCSFLQYVTSTPRLPLGGVRKLGHGGVTVDKLSTTPDGEAIKDPAVRRLKFASRMLNAAFGHGADDDVCACGSAGIVAGSSDMHTSVAPPCLRHEGGALRPAGGSDATRYRLWQRLNGRHCCQNAELLMD